MCLSRRQRMGRNLGIMDREKLVVRLVLEHGRPETRL